MSNYFCRLYEKGLTWRDTLGCEKPLLIGEACPYAVARLLSLM